MSDCSSSEYETDEDEKMKYQEDLKNELVLETKRMASGFAKSAILKLLTQLNLSADPLNLSADPLNLQTNKMNLQVGNNTYTVYLSAVSCDFESPIRKIDIPSIHQLVEQLIKSVYLCIDDVTSEYGIKLQLKLDHDTLYRHYNDQYRIGIMCDITNTEEFMAANSAYLYNNDFTIKK